MQVNETKEKQTSNKPTKLKSNNAQSKKHKQNKSNLLLKKDRSSRITREYRSLTTNTKVPLVDENLYVRSLRKRNIPYHTRFRTFGNQNNKKKINMISLLNTMSYK